MLLTFSMVFTLLFAVVPTAAAATVINHTAPAGTEDVELLVPITINVAGPYSGITFDVKVSDVNHLRIGEGDYIRTGSDPRVASALQIGVYTPANRHDGLNDTYTFGFMSSANIFSGQLNAGTIRITYSGDAPQSFTLTVRIAHFPDDGQISDWMGPAVEHITVNITRASGNADPGNGNGGARPPGGGGVNVIGIPSVVIEDVTPPRIGMESFPAFIEGHPDGTFRGEDNMTRAQFVNILFKINNPTTQPVADTDNPSFADVAPGTWWYDPIEWAVDYDIVDAGGNFRPRDPITRAEVAVMLARADGLTDMADNIFSDIDNHPSRDQILMGVHVGIFTGYPDGTFRPDNPITRFELTAAMVRYLLGGEPTDEIWQDIPEKFTDVAKTHWAYKYLALASTGYVAIPATP